MKLTRRGRLLRTVVILMTGVFAWQALTSPDVAPAQQVIELESADGKIGLLSVGMSNTTQEYSRFKQIADADPAKSRQVVIVDGAQGGETAMRWADKIRHAGAMFLGQFSSESLGDYCAGPNHVLPTSRTARFSSPLGVYDFQKRSSIIQVSAAGAVAPSPFYRPYED